MGVGFLAILVVEKERGLLYGDCAGFMRGRGNCRYKILFDS